MTFLPIVDRELRVASRRKGTYWIRVVAAAFLLLIAASFLGITTAGRSSRILDGHWLFLTLSWLAFISTSLCGIFLTSDSLSEEKREGTLGLLFLTDLRGFDVVLGKLAATSLQAFYGLLAIFPVFALPLLLGGVTAELFGKTLLIFINTLFFSLAVGIFVSAISHDSQKSINGTLLLLTGIFLLTLLVDWRRSDWNDAKFSALFSFISPLLGFSEALQNQFRYFWPNILISHLVAWIFLIAASIYTPRHWQQKETVKKSWLARRADKKKSSTAQRRQLDENPAVWLASRQSGQAFLFKLLLIGACLLVGAITFSNWHSAQGLGSVAVVRISQMIGVFLSFLLTIWLAAQSSRFFVDAKRSGALELLLCSPLPAKTIVEGHWKALCQGFAFPILLTLAIKVGSTILNFSRMGSAMSPTGGPDLNWSIFIGLQVVVLIVTNLISLAAIVWFGMWMGMTTNKPSLAVIKTFVFVVVIPSIVIMIAQGFIQTFLNFNFSSAMSTLSMNWRMLTTPIVSGILYVITDFYLIKMARRKLSRFRELAADVDHKRISIAPVQAASSIIANTK